MDLNGVQILKNILVFKPAKFIILWAQKIEDFLGLRESERLSVSPKPILNRFK